MRKTLMLGAAAVALAIAAPTLAGPSDPATTDGIILVQDRTAPGTPGTRPGTGPSAQDRRAEQAQQERMQRLTSAQPAEKLAVSGDAIMGTEVRNTQDQKLGSVKDLLLKDGKIIAIIVGRGGVLGMGTDYHQVDWAQVKMTNDMKTIVLDLSEDQVKALPKMAHEKGVWNPAPAAAEKSPPPKTAPGAPPSRTTDTPAKKDDTNKDEMKKDEPAKKDEGPSPKKDE